MKRQEFKLYPEQYELYEKQDYLRVTRRNFFRLLGGGIGVALSLQEIMAAAALEKELGLEEADDLNDTLASWIHISETGTITVFTGKVEVGQNIRTSLTQIVAEELRIDTEAIEMIMGDTSQTPYDRGTFGSLTTPTMSPILRKAAATLREELAVLAAQLWKTSASAVTVDNGFVKNVKTGKSIQYSGLTKGKKILKPLQDAVELTPPEQWKVAGKSIPKIKGRDFITGKHQYTSDIHLPGMVYGKIIRPPAYGATLLSADTRKARSMPGITVVEEENFIGVTASDSHSAERAAWEITANWKTSDQPSKEILFKYFKEKSEGGREELKEGDVASVYKTAQHILDQRFTVDYIAHVPLEPRSAVARWDDGHLTVWTGTQRPFGVQEELERHFRMAKDKIRVIMPDTGSGYGGKHTGETAIEAARLAKAVGKPVKVTWTREEEFWWAYFRPAGLIEVKSSYSKQGSIETWEFHNYNSGSAGIRSPYLASNQLIEFHPVNSPLRQGSYRALAATANVFARECQINDMAVALNLDPVEFRLKNLKDQRLKDVLTATAKSFQWNKPRAKGRGYGIACAFEKGGYTALAVEVEIGDNEQFKIIRIVSAFECGKIINPRHLKSQVSGCILQGLGGALFESIDFRDGKILNPSLANYRVPRFRDVPDLEIILIDRPDIESTGAGEAPIVGIAPAIRNAIFDATGKKLYSLPLMANGLRA